MSSLKNKVALITGVSRRKSIGFGIADKLALSGATLFLHSFSKYDRMMSLQVANNELELIHEDLSKYNIQIEQHEADFNNPDSPSQLIEAAVNRFHHIDILIINHTYDSLKSIYDLTAREIDLHLAINVRASLLLIKEYINQHDGRKGGRIILLTSGHILHHRMMNLPILHQKVRYIN